MRTDSLEPDLISAALQLHNAGNLPDAKRLYERVLAQSPDHADALHLLGVVYHQQGDSDRAVQLIDRAIEICPEDAAFYSNLAEAHRARGQFDKAIQCCQQAIRIAPNVSQARNNWGMALMDSGDYAGAHEQFTAGLQSDPQSSLLLNNLGNVLRALHRESEAVECFRRAVELRPDMPEANSNLGQMLFEFGQYEQALVHCREAVRLAPQWSAPLNNLGNVLRKLGKLDEARQAYAAAIKIDPDLGMAHNNIGQSLEEDGLFDEAIAWFRQALEHDPNSAHIHTSLGRALASQDGRDPQGLSHFERAVAIDPKFAEAHDAWGNMLLEQGKMDEAIQRLEQALALDPNLASANATLGRCRIHGGDREAAVALFRQAIRSDPIHVAAYAGLAAAAGCKLEERDAQTMQQMIDRSLVSARKQSDLHFALANVRDAQRWFSVAAKQAERANEIRHRLNVDHRRAFDPDAHVEMVDRLIDAFGSDFFGQVSDWGLDTEVPVFHFGLPRSGKSLAELIVAAHPDVHGAGELKLGNDSFEAFPDVLGIDALPIDCVGRWTEASVRQVAQRHLAALQSLAPDARRIVDTMPHNYLALGVIATLFPRAKIVHCRRDVRDVAVACWFKNFKHLNWSFHIDHLVVRIEQYQRIMEHWRTVLPISIFEIDYEQMVTDPRPVAEKLMDFIGLPWHPSCADVFDRHDEQVSGAGQWQDARPPFTSEFIGRWQEYRKPLHALFEKI